MNLRPLTATDAPGCDAVIASLPYFFGDPDGIRECAEAVRTQPGWVVEHAGVVVGFLTLRYRFPHSPEISWLAVLNERRRSGIGGQLVERVSAELAGDGAEILSVLTLGPSVPEQGVLDGYGGTREFYGRLGFVPVAEFQPESWNSGTALLLVRCFHSLTVVGGSRSRWEAEPRV